MDSAIQRLNQRSQECTCLRIVAKTLPFTPNIYKQILQTDLHTFS